MRAGAGCRNCEGNTCACGKCGSAPDGRTVGTRAALEPEFLRCPVHGCHMGPDANVYRAVVTAPNGLQRSVRGCLHHLAGSVEQALSAIRLEPFE